MKNAAKSVGGFGGKAKKNHLRFLADMQYIITTLVWRFH